MDPLKSKNFELYLRPTVFIDSESKTVRDFANDICDGKNNELDKAVHLYYEIRDKFLYDPYNIDLSINGMKASTVLEKGRGFCIPKALLLAAAARVVNIPSRLGFADVKNHLATKRLKDLLETDVFVFHGYAQLYLCDKWVKATPAFNLSLCKKFKVKPLEFDGKSDSLFHEFNSQGKKHMEYLKERGIFADLPYKKMIRAFKKAHPNAFSTLSINIKGSFEEDAENEQ
jgi:transglutaminase-like putative cysteine protease